MNLQMTTGPLMRPQKKVQFQDRQLTEGSGKPEDGVRGPLPVAGTLRFLKF